MCAGYLKGCPVGKCSAPLSKVTFRKSELPFSPDHEIRLHANTFVYHGASKSGRDSRLRNFVFQPNYVAQHVLDSKQKGETHRLGYEMSEDALSWNAFVGLLEARGLRDVTRWLIGREVADEPELYLWGSRVDLATSERKPEPFAPLVIVRRLLEPTIKRFPTEPDIMLVTPKKLVVCIEAKFGSGNPLAHDEAVRAGEKHTVLSTSWGGSARAPWTSSGWFMARPREPASVATPERGARA